jgi:hypothetical protein
MIGIKKDVKETTEKKSDEPFKIKFEFVIVPHKERTISIIVE